MTVQNQPTGSCFSCRSSWFVQLYACLAVVSSMLGAATSLAWGILACQQLQDPAQWPRISDAQNTWLLTSQYLGSAMGAALGTWAVPTWGPRFTMLASLPVTLIGYMIISFSYHYSGIMVGRVICGAGSAVPGNVSALYIGGSCCAHRRGRLLMLPDCVCVLATAVCVAAGGALSWRALAAPLAVVATLPAALLLWPLPEEPVWLRRRGRAASAERAAAWLRVQAENDNAAAAATSIISGSTTLATSISNDESSSRRALAIGALTVVFSVFSGYNALFCYALVYFEEAGGGGGGTAASAGSLGNSEAGNDSRNSSAAVFTADHVFVTLCAVRIAVTLLLTFVVDRVGRRKLMTASAAGLAVAYFALVVVSSRVWHLEQAQLRGSVVLALVLSANVFYCLGLGPVTWCVVGEMFPSTIRHQACGWMLVLYHLLTFLLLQLFPTMWNWCGERGVYLLYGILSALASLFFLTVLPETKGLTLCQIDLLYVNERKTGGKRWSRNLRRIWRTATRRSHSSRAANETTALIRPPDVNGGVVSANGAVNTQAMAA